MEKVKAIMLAFVAAVFFCLGSFLIEDQVVTANTSVNSDCYSCVGDSSKCTDLFYGDAVVYPCEEQKLQ